MVTIQKMNENEMGNRGSKSITTYLKGNNVIVKEQRVNGNYFGCNASPAVTYRVRTTLKYPELRCTLTGFERNYHSSNLSKQIFLRNNTQKRTFNTNTVQLNNNITSLVKVINP
jgi:hypothetical protein